MTSSGKNLVNGKRTLTSSIPALICASILAPAIATAADESAAAPQGIVPIPQYSGDWWTRAYLTDDWDGHRTELANRGVQIDVDWTQYVQAITDGGTDRVTEYGGHLDYVVKLDLMRMNLVPGGLVTMRLETRYGDSVNGQSGVVLPVNTTALFPLTDELDDTEALTITDLNYTQFLSERFAVTIGKIDTLDADLNDFAAGRGKSQFMDANLLFNAAMALRLPYSTLGIGALWIASETFSINASLINTIDSSTSSGFDDIGDGASAAVEADWQYRLGNLPGGMNLGGLYSYDQDFTKVTGRLIFQPGQGLSVENEDDTWAVYWTGWQYLWTPETTDRPIDVRDGRQDLRGIGLFARVGFADEDTNPVEWSVSAGVSGRGIVPSRGEDAFGVGFYYKIGRASCRERG